MKVKIFAVFLLLCSCASTPVDYLHYTVWPSKNLLRAHDPSGKDDLDLQKTCDPNQQSQGPCIGLLEADYYAMDAELKDLRFKVQNCNK